MSKDFLFAINTDTEEVIISESAKGTNKINYIERIKKSDNEMLYHAVNTLTSITKSSIMMLLYLRQWIKSVS